MERQRHRTLLAVTLLIAVGAAVGPWLEPATSALLLGSGLLFVASWVRRRMGGPASPPWVGRALAGIALVSGAAWARPPVGAQPPVALHGRTTAVRAMLIEDAQLSQDGLRARGLVWLSPTDSRPHVSWVYFEGSAAGMAKGTTVAGLAKVKELEHGRNPGSARLGEGDPTLFARFVPTPSPVVLPLASRSLPSAARDWVRASSAPPLAEPARGLALALLTGDAAAVDPATKQLFVDTGTAHLLAISGLQVAWVAAVVLWLSRVALRRVAWAQGTGVGEKLARLVAATTTVVYLGFAGSQGPTQRACIMACVALTSALVGRRPDGPTAWAAALLAALLPEPQSIEDASVQLSFGAVAALLVAGFAIRDTAPHTPFARGATYPLRRALWALVWTSIAAHAATAPIAAAHFGLTSWGAPLVNAIAVPFSTVVVSPLLAAHAVVCSAAPAEACGVVAGVTEWSLHGLVSMLEWLRPVALCTPTSAPSPLSALLLFGAGICGAALPWSWRIAGTASAGLYAAGWLCLSLEAPSLPSGVKLRFLDVGHGDAALVTAPSGHTMLLDGGGGGGPRGGAVGQRVVLPALAALHIRELEVVAVSHGDADHVQGLLPVVGRVATRELWYAEAGEMVPAFGALSATAVMRGAVLRPLARGDLAELGPLHLQVLHPPRAPPGGRPAMQERSRNDASLVLRLQWGESSALFSGDIEAQAEAELSAAGLLEPVSVLKVPHHGSKTSTTPAFARALRPRIAVVSCDEHAPYGLPDAEPLQRLQQVGAQVIRTDKYGALEVDLEAEGVRWRAPHAHR